MNKWDMLATLKRLADESGLEFHPTSNGMRTGDPLKPIEIWAQGDIYKVRFWLKPDYQVVRNRNTAEEVISLVRQQLSTVR